MDRDTLEMLRSSLRRVLTEQSDKPFARRLEELGWDEVVDEHASAAKTALFELRGETLSTAEVLGAHLAVPLADVMVLDRSLRGDQPAGRLEGDRLTVNGMVVSLPPIGASAAVMVDDGIALVPVDEGWSFADLRVPDEDSSIACTGGTVDANRITWLRGESGMSHWDRALARGRWAIAAELVGIAQHVLVRAVAYTAEREQYGAAIGTFQALQHRAASAHVLVVAARNLVAEAADSGSSWDALVAKSLAGRAAEFACTQAQQCYGAIGFTWEHEFHRYLRRTYVLDRLLGDWRTLEWEIGTQLQIDRVVPRIGSL